MQWSVVLHAFLVYFRLYPYMCSFVMHHLYTFCAWVQSQHFAIVYWAVLIMINCYLISCERNGWPYYLHMLSSTIHCVGWHLQGCQPTSRWSNFQGWEVRQESVANKEAHKDPIINGSLQRRGIQNTAEISLDCYTTAKHYVLLMSRQSWLVSGGSKNCSQI